ncbi:nuclear protein MDM1 isoform X2 [Diabrotica virgifera virgifera]|uniref:Nuclear protein MDM1 n=1 Tax=Diabrotica virgifera virgifera TaxID=50390 RepID=A0ABM5LAU5_DIAVI|nr:nuclear protein MDM1 isoform X2 [Diabrotica virgifera virgifera]
MIGSFWNLCRACPSMPVDKLHSEYRSTYRWHEYTGPRQEVVRRPPQTNVSEKTNDINEAKINEDDFHASETMHKPEPAMPRRKKYPDLAYRHTEFISSDRANDFNSADRARSEERNGSEWKPSRRSKSEGPARNAIQVDGTVEGERERRRESDPDMENTNTGKDGSLLRKAISKLSTEYRLQFAWPQGHTSRREAAGSTPRKSHSMGALKARAQANAMVQKNRIHLENRDASELEPLVDDKNNRERCREEFNTEYKKKFRPFSQYEYTERGFSSKGVVDPIEEVHKNLTENDKNASWYKEVVELRKKAGEYKHRGWGSELAPERLSDIYNKQIELWNQVSRRSSLSALSLASMPHKNFTKEEKEDDNNRKSSPTKAYRNAENSARMIRDIIRHHLERTTGGSDLDGLILSPTREKLEPTIPRKDDDSRGSQKNSPKKSSPLKSSSLKRTNQKTKQVRSQSVGPITENNVEKRSPKRQSRSTTAKEGRKSSSETPSSKRPRPSSLNTTVSSRSKSTSVVTKHEDDRLAKPLQTQKSIDSSKQNQKVATKDRKGVNEADQTKTDTVENKDNSTNEEYDSLTYEPVIKSPPEPTRVKSPEQIIMRSPDPVNWTVPLDTGKTFTVTQNVREGDIGSRPHSEVKVWTPPDIPPPVAQSAPPTLTEQTKEPAGLS